MEEINSVKPFAAAQEQQGGTLFLVAPPFSYGIIFKYEESLIYSSRLSA